MKIRSKTIKTKLISKIYDEEGKVKHEVYHSLITRKNRSPYKDDPYAPKRWPLIMKSVEYIYQDSIPVKKIIITDRYTGGKYISWSDTVSIN